MAKPKSVAKKINFPPLNLSKRNLPTKFNVICAINSEAEGKNTTHSEAIGIVAENVISLWNKCSLPIIHAKSVRYAIKNYYRNYLEIVKANQNRMTYEKKLDDFKVFFHFRSTLGLQLNYDNLFYRLLLLNFSIYPLVNVQHSNIANVQTKEK